MRVPEPYDPAKPIKRMMEPPNRFQENHDRRYTEATGNPLPEFELQARLLHGMLPSRDFYPHSLLKHQLGEYLLRTQAAREQEIKRAEKVSNATKNEE